MKKLIATDLVWICGSDLASGTSDEKRECMGYDSIPPLGLVPRRLRIVDPVRENQWRRMMVVVLSLDFHRYTNVKASQMIPTPHLSTHTSLT